MDIANYSHIKIDRVLSLDQLKIEDSHKFFQLIEENREYLSELLPELKHIKTLEDAEGLINESINARASGEQYSYGIKNKGELVGYISLNNLKDSNSPDINYWVVQRYRGRGIATRATGAITNLAISGLFLPHVIIKADQRSIGANRIPQKLGYRHSSTIKEAGQKINVWEIIQ